MTKDALQKLIGRAATWNPAARSRGATLRVAVTIEAVRSICGRSECLIVPNAGKGATWVKRTSLSITKLPLRNFY